MRFIDAVKLKVGAYILYQEGGIVDRVRVLRVVRVDREDDHQTLKCEWPNGNIGWVYNHRIISVAENQK